MIFQIQIAQSYFNRCWSSFNILANLSIAMKPKHNENVKINVKAYSLTDVARLPAWGKVLYQYGTYADV